MTAEVIESRESAQDAGFVQQDATARKLKICMSIHGFALGGMEEHAVDLAGGLAARGHGVTMLLPHQGGGPLAPLAPRLMAAGVRVEQRRLLDLERFGERVAARWSLVRWMRSQRFDVLHLHRYNPYHSHALPALAALAGVRQRFVSEHDPGLEFKTPPRIVASFGDSFVTRWIVASSFSERCFRERTRRDPAKLSRVALGIPTERFHEVTPASRAAARAKFGIAPETLAVGTVCRLVSLKGIDDLLAAAPRLLDRFPSMQILIAGDGPESGRLAAAAATLGDRVRFVGRVASAAAFLPALDIFAFPSRYEGFGLAISEAMTAGLPVVGTRVGAIEELVTSSGGGEVVPPNDPDALGAAIERLASSAAAREQAGKSARSYALRELSLSAMIDRFENLFVRGAAEIPPDAVPTSGPTT